MIIGAIVLCFVGLVVYLLVFTHVFMRNYNVLGTHIKDTSTTTQPLSIIPQPVTLDVTAYNAKLKVIANNPPPRIIKRATTSTPAVYATTTYAWPVKAVLPNGGALLPFNRIVAYYGNYYSTLMGVLGQYSEDEMLKKLQGVVAEWQAADPSTPVIPAIDYIDVTAQGSPGKDGKYRLRMPDTQIDKSLAIAAKVNGIVILDIQVGLSNVQSELPLLQNYLKLPNVQLALDPEFSMKDGARPDTEIGTMDATDINYVSNYLAGIVSQYNLPPKILVVHRFTEDMVTHYKNIVTLPQVQIVMDMDGWGSQAKKINTYQRVIESEPVQFTGFKLFYKNDLLPPSTGMLTPAQILQLTPNPSFIQYQ